MVVEHEFPFLSLFHFHFKRHCLSVCLFVFLCYKQSYFSISVSSIDESVPKEGKKKKHVSLSQLLGVERSDADFTSSVLSLLLCRCVSRTKKKAHDPGF